MRAKTFTVASVWEQAVALAPGQIMRLAFADHTAALTYRMMLYQERRRVRSVNRATRAPTDPEYGKSPYDDLVVGLEAHYLTIQRKWNVKPLRITVGKAHGKDRTD